MTILLGLAGLAAVIVQMVLPAWFSLFSYYLALICLMPIYALFYVGITEALILAGVFRSDQDILSPGIIGFTSVSLGGMLLLLSTQRRSVLVEGKILAIPLVIGGTFFYLALDYILFCLWQGRWHWPLHLLVRLVAEALINGVLFFPLSWILDSLQTQWYGKHWKPRVEYADT